MTKKKKTAAPKSDGLDFGDAGLDFGDGGLSFGDEDLDLSDGALNFSEEEEKPDVPPEEAVPKVLTAFQQRAKNEEQRFYEATDTEFWFCVCFETREQKEEFLAKSAFAETDDKYIDGLSLADKLKIKIVSPRLTKRKTRTIGRLEELL